MRTLQSCDNIGLDLWNSKRSSMESKVIILGLKKMDSLLEIQSIPDCFDNV